jgi:Tol biopolymer transport system component
MTAVGRRAVAYVVVVGSILLAGGVTADAAPARDPSPARPLLVWAQDGTGLRNLHLRSARVDGSRLRKVFDNPRGFTTSLVMDPSGRRVALATCCRADLPSLVVAPVGGGRHREPLARHPELEAVSGIGWSPDGRSLAFQAVTDRGGARTASIWTVGVDGSRLHEVLELGDVLADDAPSLDETMAWTDDGILYTEDLELLLATDGRATRVMGNVGAVRVSGDGSRLVLLRGAGAPRIQVWVARPDGSGARRVAALPTGGDTMYSRDVVPNHDGSRLMVLRSTYRDGRFEHRWMAWDVDGGLRSAVPLPITDTVAAAWR